MSSTMLSTLIPAYGRDYKSKAEVLKDFLADKDFLIQSVGLNGYINKSGIETDLPHVTSIQIRYKQQRQVAVLTKSKKGEWK